MANPALLRSFAFMASSTCEVSGIVRPLCLSRQMRRPTFEGVLPPKKPLNQYLIFVMENTMQVSKDRGSRKVLELAKMWKKLPPETKQYYKLKYEQQKKEYAETRREFLDQLGDKEAQKKYLDSVKDYVKKKNEFMKYWKLKSGSNPKNLSCKMLAYKLFVSSKSEEFPEDQREAYVNDKHWCEWDDLSLSVKDEYLMKAASISRRRLEEIFSEKVADPCPSHDLKDGDDESKKKELNV